MTTTLTHVTIEATPNEAREKTEIGETLSAEQ